MGNAWSLHGLDLASRPNSVPRAGAAGLDPAVQRGAGDSLVSIQLCGGRVMAQLQLTEWGLGFWQQGVAILIATAPLP